MSKLPPPPYHATVPSAASYPPPSSSPADWLGIGYIHDQFSKHCQRAQGRPFLRTGVKPAIGQRVELTVFLSSEARERLPFRLSGEIVNFSAPRWDGTGAAGKDTAVHHSADAVDALMGIAGDTARGSAAWRPSTSTEDCGMGGGSMALAHMVRGHIVQQRPCLEVTGEMLASTWEHYYSDEKKEEVSRFIEKKLGALHGQRVVFEGRLNFDYDIRRGTEEGPWIDGIPFDGRDVWQFTLVADDSMENMWRADPHSFVNLGPHHRPRCWPWSNGAALPYQRSGADAPLRGPGPDGAISVHICIGPHGCSGKDHPHSYQAQAA